MTDTLTGFLYLISAVLFILALRGLSNPETARQGNIFGIAGMVIAAFPYGVEVIARLSGVRDFFLTLFFVALGMKMPAPTGRLLVLTAAAAVRTSRRVEGDGIFIPSATKNRVRKKSRTPDSRAMTSTP